MSECNNLGPNEIRKRKIFGTFGLILYIIFLFYFLTHDVSFFVQLTILVPVAFTVVGFYQAEQKTCLAIAVMGVENFDGGNVRVANEERRKEIIKKGWQMIQFSAITSITITLATLYVIYLFN